jgi:hypothetical protein
VRGVVTVDGVPDEPADLDPDVLAGLVLAADLVPWPGGPVWNRVRLLLTVVIGVAMEIDSFADVSGALIVTRMDNGAMVQLTRSRWEDDRLLTYVRQQLAELTVGEFLDRWGVDPAALRDRPGRQDGADPHDSTNSQDGADPHDEAGPRDGAA